MLGNRMCGLSFSLFAGGMDIVKVTLVKPHSLVCASGLTFHVHRNTRVWAASKLIYCDKTKQNKMQRWKAAERGRRKLWEKTISVGGNREWTIILSQPAQLPPFLLKNCWKEAFGRKERWEGKPGSTALATFAVFIEKYHFTTIIKNNEYLYVFFSF